MPPPSQLRAEARKLSQWTQGLPNSVPGRGRKAVGNDQIVEFSSGGFGDDDGRHRSQFVQRYDPTGMDVRKTSLRTFVCTRYGIEERGDGRGVWVGMI